MNFLRFAVAVLGSLLASCGKVPEPASCGEATDCLASAHGVVIGHDASARLAATRELQSAAASYSAWFPGDSPLAGLVVLDAAAAGKTSIVRGTFWTLNYDLAARPVLDGNSDFLRSGPRNTGLDGASGNRTSLAAGRENGEFDMARPGVLAHEICHRYAARVFARVWGRSRSGSDMLDEVAAISCETEELRAGRLDLFARLFADGKLIPWESFLVTRHPLKTDQAMIRTLRQLGAHGRGAVTFDIKPGSSYGSKVALFYSQAAAFGDFVSTRSCRGRRTIGALLATYDPREGLDQWLRSSGAEFCLPTSTGEFEETFSQFMKQGTGRPPSARPRIPRSS